MTGGKSNEFPITRRAHYVFGNNSEVFGSAKKRVRSFVIQNGKMGGRRRITRKKKNWANDRRMKDERWRKQKVNKH